MRDMHMFRRAP